MNFASDPHYRELQRAREDAVRRESIIRESAFLPIILSICGIPVRPMTLAHYSFLDFANNPILQGGDVELCHIIEFIWIVSTEFVPSNPVAYRAFIEKYSIQLNLDSAYVECNQYIRDALLDLDRSKTTNKKPNQRPYYAWMASIVDTLASQYGWTYEYIMHQIPIAVVLQMMRCIQQRMSMTAGDAKEVTFSNALSDIPEMELHNYINECVKRHNTSGGKI